MTRRTGKRGASARVVLAAVCVAAASLASPALATIIQFSGAINGAQETPPNGSAAAAFGNYTMDTDANTLQFSIVESVPPPSGEIAAHIHGFAGPGVPAGILFALPAGAVKNGTWNFMEAQEASIIAGLTYTNIHSSAFPGGEIRGQIVRIPLCGDGILDGGESCDDGNLANGDCCDASCNLEPGGSSCSGSSPCASNGMCDGAGNCVAAPRGTCRTALKSILAIKDDGEDSKDKLIYKFIKGQQTNQADFGMPTGTSGAYALCIYAGTTQTLIAEPAIAYDPVKWSPISTKGFKYKDPAGTSSGVQKVILKGGDEGKTKTLVKGKGAGLPIPALDLAIPVVAELVNSENSVCFGSTFGLEDVIKNDAAQFKAKDQ